MSTNNLQDQVNLCSNCDCELPETPYNDTDPNLCEECFHELYFYCEDCEAFYSSESDFCYEVNTPDGEYTKIVCERCYDHYSTCDYCGHTVAEDDAQYSPILNSVVCNECYASNSNLRHCYACDHIFDTDNSGHVAIDTGNWYCSDCSDELNYCDSCDVSYTCEHCPECGVDESGAFTVL